jgi:alpha-maltose-1-phosphate synthase
MRRLFFNMIVNISSITSFFSIDLARQMERLGHLGKFYTSLLPSMTRGLPESKVRRQPILLGPLYLARKVRSERVQRFLYWQSNQWFDRWLAAQAASCDVFQCLSGMGLLAHRTVKKRYGALTVCDHGSTHIVYNNNLLREEYKRWKVPYIEHDPRVVQKHLAEYAECDLITVPSAFAMRSFIEQGVPAEKLAKIPYGVDLREFHPIPKEDDIFRVLYVGQMSIRKGIPYLMEALSSLKIRKFEFAIIAPNPPQADPFLKRFADGYAYWGPKPRSELYRYYSQASVFVMASVEEGMAMVQAQAMACGLPVIATTNTGAEDLFTDGVEGFIVPVRNPDAIREKVLYLYENPVVRNQMSQAALKRVKEIGGWDTYGECAARTYLQALKKRGR